MIVKKFIVDKKYPKENSLGLEKVELLGRQPVGAAEEKHAFADAGQA